MKRACLAQSLNDQENAITILRLDNCIDALCTCSGTHIVELQDAPCQDCCCSSIREQHLQVICDGKCKISAEQLLPWVANFLGKWHKWQRLHPTTSVLICLKDGSLLSHLGYSSHASHARLGFDACNALFLMTSHRSTITLEQCRHPVWKSHCSAAG